MFWPFEGEGGFDRIFGMTLALDFGEDSARHYSIRGRIFAEKQCLPSKFGYNNNRRIVVEDLTWVLLPKLLINT